VVHALFPADELAIGDGVDLYGLLEDAVEEEAGGLGAPAVEPERKLVEI
jgi:hypothetical protein